VTTNIDVSLSLSSLTDAQTTDQLTILYYAYYGGQLVDGVRATVPSLVELRMQSMPAALSTHLIEQSVDDMLYFNTRARHFRTSVDRGSVMSMGEMAVSIRSAKNSTAPLMNQDTLLRQNQMILSSYEASLPPPLPSACVGVGAGHERVDRVDSHARWGRPCLQTARMTIRY
jgi:hypothetical protein